MRNLIFYLVAFTTVGYSQNSGSVYATARPYQANVSDWINQQERTDFQYRGVVSTKEYFLFGGESGKVFLGCINCEKYSELSIWNSNGKFGSKYSSGSIWNIYGDYGGKQGSYSPFNNYSENAPVIVDAEGNFYGYFSANRTIENLAKYQISDFCVENWQEISKVPASYYKILFQ